MIFEKSRAAQTVFRRCLVSFILLGLTLAQAQAAREQADDLNTYFGVGADLFIAGGGVTVPAPSFQFGAEVTPQLELRGTLTTLLFVSVISADALYTDRLTDSALRYYVGGGPDLALITPLFSDTTYPLLYFAVHATAGVEYRASRLIGLYAEGQPFFVFGTGVTPGVRFRAGVNFHF